MKRNSARFSCLYHPVVAIFMFATGLLSIPALIALGWAIFKGHNDSTILYSTIAVGCYAVVYYTFRYFRARAFKEKFPYLWREYSYCVEDPKPWLINDALAFCSFRKARRIEPIHKEKYRTYESLEETHEDGIRRLQLQNGVKPRKISFGEMSDDKIFLFINDYASVPEVVESMNREVEFYKYKTDLSVPNKRFPKFPFSDREVWKSKDGYRVYSYSNEFVTQAPYYVPSVIEAFPFPMICTYRYFAYKDSEVPLPMLHLSFDDGKQYLQIKHMQSSKLDAKYFSDALSSLDDVLKNCSYYVYSFENEDMRNEIISSLSGASRRVLSNIEDIKDIEYPSTTNTVFVLENYNDDEISDAIEKIKNNFIPNALLVILKSDINDEAIQRWILSDEKTISSIKKGFEQYPTTRGIHYLSLYPYYPKDSGISKYFNTDVYKLKDRGDVTFGNNLELALKSIFDGSWYGCYLFCVPPSSGGYEKRYHRLIAEFVKHTHINVLSMPANFKYLRTSKAKHLGGDGECEIAFKEHTFTGKAVVIFDDVITSGYTIQRYKEIIERQGGYVLGAISIGETMYSHGTTAFQDMKHKSDPKEKLLDQLRGR